MHGRGKLARASGVCYEGHFIHDMRHGKVKLIRPDGSTHAGRGQAGGLGAATSAGDGKPTLTGLILDCC